MIISASRRTDIPAFYSDWFYNRIKEGFVLTRNPMNINQVSKITLSPDVIDCIVFWTKNPSNFIKRLNEIKNYQFYFQYTITGYGIKLEPLVPNIETSISTFRQTSDLIGSNRVIWRYDPIVLTDEFDINFHKRNFEFIAKNLSGYTKRCVISIVDYYQKTVRNLTDIKYTEITNNQVFELVQELSYIGKKYNLEISSCAEKYDLSKLDVLHGKCIDDKLITEVTGYSLNIDKDKNQRTECGCIASVDIGSYNTCQHGCKYCYANFNQQMVKDNCSKYEPNSPLLIGHLSEKDKVTNRKMFSCKDIQKRLF